MLIVATLKSITLITSVTCCKNNNDVTLQANEMGNIWATQQIEYEQCYKNCIICTLILIQGNFDCYCATSDITQLNCLKDI